MKSNNDKQRYTEAGEQAAQIIGEFVSMAGEFSRRIEENFGASANDHRHPSHASHQANPGQDQPDPSHLNHGRSKDSRSSDSWTHAGDYLRELREAAGLTIEGFADALNQRDAANTIKGIESGRVEFPTQWLDKAAEILKQGNPAEFFDTLKNCYDQSQNSTVASTGKTDSSTDIAAEQIDELSGSAPGDRKSTQTRAEKLASIFSDQQVLDELTDEKFDELSRFMQSSFASALQLVADDKP